MRSVQEKICETQGIRRVALGLRDEIQHRIGGSKGKAFSGAALQNLHGF